MTSVITNPLPQNGLSRAIPVDFNGYAPVARRTMRVPASEVITDDTLIVDGYLSRVYGIREVTVSGHGPAIKIDGDFNVVRFPRELVTVLRWPGAPSAVTSTGSSE